MFQAGAWLVSQYYSLVHSYAGAIALVAGLGFVNQHGGPQGIVIDQAIAAPPAPVVNAFRTVTSSTCSANGCPPSCEADEALMETFFADGTLSQEQLERGLRTAFVQAKLAEKGLKPVARADKRALIRRASGNASSELTAGDVRLDTRSGKVTKAGEPVKLTAQEYKLLSYLLHHKGKVVSRTELIEHIYDQDFDRDSNTIEVFVTRIRKKLGQDVITTIRGLGYSLEDPDA